MADGSVIPQRAEFGKYRLLALMATGGMAEIFLARVQGLAGFEKLVVIKKILPHLAREKYFVQMFFDEAKLVATLNHPNIVQTFDLGQISGQYFMAMEYLFGESSANLISTSRKAGRPIPVEIACGVILQAAAGLHHAHTRTDALGKPLGIVHRDVSPQNIFVLYEGLVKVVDFGVAKAAMRSTKSQDGTLKGKFAYMSPEQITGQELDARSDVFSLGVVFWEMLAGRKLFRQETEYEIMKAIVDQDAPAVHGVNRQVPEDLSQIISRALARDRNGRYQSAGEFHDALRDWLRTAGGEWDSVAISRFMHDLFAERMEKKQRFIEGIKARETALGDFLFGDLAQEILVEPEPSVPRTTPAAGMLAGLKRKTGKKLLPAVLILGLLVPVILGLVLFSSGNGQERPESGAVAGRPLPQPAAGGVTPAPADRDQPVEPPPAGTMSPPDERTPVVPAPTPAPPKRPGARKAPAVAEKRPPGLLRLVTVPWTEVWYGNRKLGQTPLVDVELPAGRVKLRLHNPPLILS